MKLNQLHAVHPGISVGVAGFIAEAAGVCLELGGHTSPTPVAVSGTRPGSHALDWELPTDESRDAHADHQEATEYGACAIAINLIHETEDLVVYRRSRKGTGFDYWLGPPNDEAIFEGSIRLEVSGILNGSATDVARRVTRKRKQVSAVHSPLPARVAVIEFGSPSAWIENL